MSDRITSTSGPSPSTEDILVDALSTLVMEFQPRLEEYPFPIEITRWNSLIISILQSLSDEISANTAYRAMTTLGIVSVESLTSGGDSHRARIDNLIKEILIASGLRSEDSETFLSAVHSAAETLQREYEGQLQMMIKPESERFINDMASNLGLDALDEPVKRECVTRWAQYAFNMPVYLSTAAARSFCKAYGADERQLEQAASKIDMSFRVLDDLLRKWSDAEEALSAMVEE